jgi:hypothetical protein
MTMRRVFASALMAFSALAQASPQVGVSVTVDEPGFYGRVQIGERPPRVIYQQPVIIQQTPIAVVQRPIYLRVPPGHYKRWGHYCQRYRACGQPVYFVEPGVRHLQQWRDDRRDRWDAAREAYHEKRAEQIRDRRDRRDDRRDDRRGRGHDDHHHHR